MTVGRKTSFPKECGVWGHHQHKNLHGNWLGCGLCSGFPSALLLVFEPPTLTPSISSLPLSMLVPYLQFLWWAFIWTFIHSLSKYPPATRRPWLEAVQLPKKVRIFTSNKLVNCYLATWIFSFQITRSKPRKHGSWKHYCNICLKSKSLPSVKRF